MAVVAVEVEVGPLEAEEEAEEEWMKVLQVKYAVYLLVYQCLLLHTLIVIIITEAGAFVHSAEGEMVCRLTNPQIPYFNAGIYLQNKSKIGKVEEILGPVNRVYFTIKPDTGVNPSSFAVDDKFYIGTDKLLPISRFLNEGKSGGGGRVGGRGGGRGAGGRGSPAGTHSLIYTLWLYKVFTYSLIYDIR